MRISIVFAILLTLVFTVTAIPAAEAQCPCCKFMSQGQGKGMPKYDLAKETTMKGTVEAVEQHESPMGWQGVHLKLKTEAGTIEVHVGPAWFLEEKDFQFAKGDSLEVLGSRMTIENQDSLLAREIKQGEKTLVLRDARGIPVWSGGRRRAPAN
jgi:DNA/RNA endonuclease YhcR with UshA esterase domain